MKTAALMTVQNAGKTVQVIKEIVAKLGLDGRIEVIEYPRVQELEKALLTLKVGGCWCEIGIGHPMVRNHSSACEHIQKLLYEVSK